MTFKTHLSVGGGAKRLNNHSPKSFKSSLKQISAFISLLTLIPNVALAASGTGLQKVDDFFNQVSNWLVGGGTVVCAIAFAVAGYKVMFGSQSVREVAPIILGGVLIGGGSAIAGILM